MEDAEAYKAAMGETADYSIDSFADIVEAIHVVQNEIGITGTTALEASTTIEGSINSMKASWQNLLTGFADGTQDLGSLVDQFVQSVATVASNVVPRVIETVPRVIEGIGTILSEAIPAGIGILEDAFAQVPEVIQSFMESSIDTMGPSLIGQIADLIGRIATAFSEHFPAILEKGKELIQHLIDGILAKIPDIGNNLPKVIDAIVTFFATNYQSIMSAGASIIGHLISGIISNLPEIAIAAVKIIASFVASVTANFPKILAAGLSLIANLLAGILQGAVNLIAQAGKIAANIVSEFAKIVGQMASIGANLITGLWNGITSKVSWVISKVKGVASDILGAIKGVFKEHSPSKATEEMGAFLAIGIANGIEDNADEAVKAAETMSEKILAAAEKGLEDFKKHNDLSLQDEVEFWRTIVDYTEDGTDSRIKAEEKYYDALDSFKKKHEDYVDSIMKSMDLFKEFTKNEEVTGQDLVMNLFNQVTSLNKYKNTLAELETKIGHTALFQELKEKGVGSLGELEALNALSIDRLGYYSSLYDTKASIAESMSPYAAAVNNYNFTFNSNSELNSSEARRQSKQAYNDMILGF